MEFLNYNNRSVKAAPRSRLTHIVLAAAVVILVCDSYYLGVTSTKATNHKGYFSQRSGFNFPRSFSSTSRTSRPHAALRSIIKYAPTAYNFVHEEDEKAPTFFLVAEQWKIDGVEYRPFDQPEGNPKINFVLNKPERIQRFYSKFKRFDEPNVLTSAALKGKRIEALALREYEKI